MSASTERQVAAIYETILDIPRALPSDDVFSLGGDSMKMVLIALEIEQQFKVSLPLELLERSSQIAHVAAWLDAQRVHAAKAGPGDPQAEAGASPGPVNGA